MSFEKLPKDRQTWFRKNLTEFIIRDVIYKDDGMLVDVEWLNAQSRWDMAEQWYRHQVHISSWYLDHFNELIRAHYGNYEYFIQDMAIYIDSRIPKAYIKHKEHLKKALKDIRVPHGPDMTLPYGLKYQYSENFVPNLPPQQQDVSVKQEKYLADLAKKAGFLFIDREYMTKKEATDCITFFLDMNGKSEPDCFGKYFIDMHEI